MMIMLEYPTLDVSRHSNINHPGAACSSVCQSGFLWQCSVSQSLIMLVTPASDYHQRLASTGLSGARAWGRADRQLWAELTWGEPSVWRQSRGRQLWRGWPGLMPTLGPRNAIRGWYHDTDTWHILRRWQIEGFCKLEGKNKLIQGMAPPPNECSWYLSWMSYLSLRSSPSDAFWQAFLEPIYTWNLYNLYNLHLVLSFHIISFLLSSFSRVWSVSWSSLKVP